MKAKELTGKFVGYEQSDTTGELYEICVEPSGHIVCNCWGYTSSRKRPKICKHTKRHCLRILFADALKFYGLTTEQRVSMLITHAEKVLL